MSHDRGPSLLGITPQVIVGLLVIGFGLTLTAENLRIIERVDVWRYWSVVLIAIGVLKVLQPRQRSGRFFGVLLILIGTSVTLDQFWAIDIDLDRIWPLGFVVIGLIIVSRAWRVPSSPEAQLQQGMTTSSDTVLSEFAFWSAVKRRVASPSFRRADLTAIMGGIELDLRPSGTGSGEAVIDVFVMWGGIEITVPPDWDVSNRIVPIMGGADDKSTGTQDSKHRLVLRGFVIMGGVDIKT